jgi:hypothetical protein
MVQKRHFSIEVGFYYHDFHKKSIMKKKAGSLMKQEAQPGSTWTGKMLSNMWSFQLTFNELDRTGMV